MRIICNSGSKVNVVVGERKRKFEESVDMWSTEWVSRRNPTTMCKSGNAGQNTFILRYGGSVALPIHNDAQTFCSDRQVTCYHVLENCDNTW